MLQRPEAVLPLEIDNHSMQQRQRGGSEVYERKDSNSISRSRKVRKEDKIPYTPNVIKYFFVKCGQINFNHSCRKMSI
jgi:hypothetical protein